MLEITGGENEYKCDSGERVWIIFDTINWANLEIEMQINDGPFEVLKQHFYSFKSDDTKRHITLKFTFINPAACYIAAYGESGGDRYDGRAVWEEDRPDFKEFNFHE